MADRSENGPAPAGLFAIMRELFAQLPRRRKLQGLVIVLGAMVAAVAETVSLGAVIPLLKVLYDLESVMNHHLVAPHLDTFGITDEVTFLYIVAGGFIALILLTSGARLALTWALNRWVFGVGYDLGIRIFGTIMRQRYEYYLTTPSKESLVGLERVSTVCGKVLRPMVFAVSSVIIALCILSALIWIEPVSALSAMGGFVFIYLVAVLSVRRRLTANSERLVEAQRERVGLVQEGLGNIRDVILDNSSRLYLGSFRRWDGVWRSCQATNQILVEAPRYIIEATGMILILCLALVLWHREGGLSDAVPLLAALALGARKLVPELQRVYTGWTQALGALSSLQRVLLMLKLAPADEQLREAIDFDEELVLTDVSYRYPAAEKLALRGVSLRIAKGERVGLAGPSGSGKSTLMDLIMGLLEPTHGVMSVDGRTVDTDTIVSWRSRIAHVPQSVFLMNTSIAENIALGERPEDIDYERLDQIIDQVMLRDLVNDRSQGVFSSVGERGASLSGGQIQRVAIARALYKRATVLVLDEATSALDQATERGIVDCLGQLDPGITVLMIAHRLSTLESCDRIIELRDGEILRETDFATLTARA